MRSTTFTFCSKYLAVLAENGSDVEVVAEADDPNPHRVSRRAVASEGRDLQLFCCSDLVKLIYRPGCHQRVSLLLGPQSGLVLFVADLFHPVGSLAVEMFLNGDVCPGRDLLGKSCRGVQVSIPVGQR